MQSVALFTGLEKDGAIVVALAHTDIHHLDAGCIPSLLCNFGNRCPYQDTTSGDHDDLVVQINHAGTNDGCSSRFGQLDAF